MMKIGLCALLSFAYAQNNETNISAPRSNLRGLPAHRFHHVDSDDEIVVKVRSHEPHDFNDLIKMTDVAAKRNLRGVVNIGDLTNCDESEKNNSRSKIRTMPEKTIRLEFTQLSDDDKK